MFDRSTKIILAAIAAGLWANAAAYATRPAFADSYMLTRIKDTLDAIEGATRGTEAQVYRIAKGDCGNPKLC